MSEKLVRVRGGPKGYRMISLEDWKQEIKERKGRLAPAVSKRKERMDAKRKKRVTKKRQPTRKKRRNA